MYVRICILYISLNTYLLCTERINMIRTYCNVAAIGIDGNGYKPV